MEEPTSGKRMKLRYAGACRLCGVELPARTEAVYEQGLRTVRCLACDGAPMAAQPASDPPERVPGGSASRLEAVTSEPEPELVPGTAGSSARREYERRKANDEARLRAQWGRLGGIAVALADERQSTASWERGAIGEERLGVRLDALASADISVLHDRRIPGTRANIDHLLITRGGVWVVDAKRYRGRPVLRVEGGILRPRVERLLVGRRDCTKLVEGVLKQVHLVREALTEEVPVTGAVCFVDADWPLIGGSFTTRRVEVLWPRQLVKVVGRREGALDVEAVTRVLAGCFVPA